MHANEAESLSLEERAALGKLFEDHAPRLLAIIQRRMDPKLRARTTPEDILQNAYVLGQGKWARFRASSMPPFKWLYTLVVDAYIGEWRRQTAKGRDLRLERAYPDKSCSQMVLGLVASQTGPNSRLVRAERDALVQKVLALLCESDRDLLLKRHVDGLSFKEIGDVLDISENAAKVRELRALRRLTALWKEQSPSE